MLAHAALRFLRLDVKGQLYLFSAMALLLPLILFQVRIAGVIQGILFLLLLLWQLVTGWVLLLRFKHRDAIRWGWMLLLPVYLFAMIMVPALREYIGLMKLGATLAALFYYFRCRRETALLTLGLLGDRPTTNPYDFSGERQNL